MKGGIWCSNRIKIIYLTLNVSLYASSMVINCCILFFFFLYKVHLKWTKKRKSVTLRVVWFLFEFRIEVTMWLVLSLEFGLKNRTWTNGCRRWMNMNFAETCNNYGNWLLLAVQQDNNSSFTCVVDPISRESST